MIVPVKWYKLRSSGARYEVLPELLCGIDRQMTSKQFVDRRKCKPKKVKR